MLNSLILRLLILKLFVRDTTLSTYFFCSFSFGVHSVFAVKILKETRGGPREFHSKAHDVGLQHGGCCVLLSLAFTPSLRASTVLLPSSGSSSRTQPTRDACRPASLIRRASRSAHFIFCEVGACKRTQGARSPGGTRNTCSMQKHTETQTETNW